MAKQTDLPAGSEIPVKINGKTFVTVIHSDGVQRLPSDQRLAELIDSGSLCLNRLAVATKVTRQVKAMTRRWIYQNIGYSVTGYSEIFPNDRIENPLWD